MVLDTLSDWLRLFLLLGIPGMMLALLLAWVTARISRFLQSARAVEAAREAQRRVLSGRAPVHRLTLPRFNRGLIYFFLGFAVLMLIMWLAKLLQLLLA